LRTRPAIGKTAAIRVTISRAIIASTIVSATVVSPAATIATAFAPGVSRTTFARATLAGTRFDRTSLGGASFGSGALDAVVVQVFVFFEEVGHVEERVALQAQVHEGGLHAGEYARNASFMDAARERIFIRALEVDLH
jgi:hypothetical protein